MKNKIVPIILIFIMSLSSSVFASDTNIVSWTDMLDFFEENIRVDLSEFENIDKVKNKFNSSNKFWLFDDGIPCTFTGSSSHAFDKTSYSTNYWYISFGDCTFRYNNSTSNKYWSITNTNYFLIDIENKKCTQYSTNNSLKFDLDKYVDFSATTFSTQLAIEYIVDTITLEANNFTLTAGNQDLYDDIIFNEINASDYPWNNQTGGETIAPDYSYEIEDNGIFPEIYTNYYNGYVPKNTTKPSYILDEYYNGENYYNVQFKIKIDQNAIYDWSTTKIILGIYELQNIDGQIKPKLHEYMEADAMAVYESGDNHLGFDIYTYDLFNIWNHNGNIDTHINAYGIDNIGFALHLYDDKNGQLQNQTNLLMFTTEYINDNPNINDNINSDINFGENTDFWVLLENTKQFLNKFLSFFNIFPMWLNTLIATAVTVAIICRIIGR